MNTSKLSREERKSAKRKARAKRRETFASFSWKEWEAYRKVEPKEWKGLKNFLKAQREGGEKKDAAATSSAEKTA